MPLIFVDGRSFTDEDLRKVHKALIHSGLVEERAALLSGIDLDLTSGLRRSSSPSAQILMDLHSLRRIRTYDGRAHPFVCLLHNALALTRGLPETVVFETALAKVHATTTYEPSPRGSVSSLGSVGARCLLAHAGGDASIARDLIKHLTVLAREEVIALTTVSVSSDDRDLLEIDLPLDTVDVFLFLVSAELLASLALRKAVIEPALQRSGRGAAVVPILARPSPVSSSLFGRLRPLPKDGVPISRQRCRELALVDVVGSVLELSRALPRS